MVLPSNNICVCVCVCVRLTYEIYIYIYTWCTCTVVFLIFKYIGFTYNAVKIGENLANEKFPLKGVACFCLNRLDTCTFQCY